MSTKSLRWAFEQNKLKPTERIILLVLADIANHKNECWPSYQQIAESANVSRRTVIDAIKRLEDFGLIQIELRATEYGGSNANVYRLMAGEL